MPGNKVIFILALNQCVPSIVINTDVCLDRKFKTFMLVMLATHARAGSFFLNDSITVAREVIGGV